MELFDEICNDINGLLHYNNGQISNGNINGIIM